MNKLFVHYCDNTGIQCVDVIDWGSPIIEQSDLINIQQFIEHDTLKQRVVIINFRRMESPE